MQILGHCNQKGTMVDTEIPKVTDDMLSLDFPSDYAYIAKRFGRGLRPDRQLQLLKNLHTEH